VLELLTVQGVNRVLKEC